MALSGQIRLVSLLPQGKRKLRPRCHCWLFLSVLLPQSALFAVFLHCSFLRCNRWVVKCCGWCPGVSGLLPLPLHHAAGLCEAPGRNLFVFITPSKLATSYGAVISALCFHVTPTESWEKGSLPFPPALRVELEGYNIIAASSLIAQDLLHAATYWHKFPRDGNMGETKPIRDLLHPLLPVPPWSASPLPSLSLEASLQASPQQETFFFGTWYLPVDFLWHLLIPHCPSPTLPPSEGLAAPNPCPAEMLRGFHCSLS